MNDNEVRFEDQTLRDGPQSLWATRTSAAMMLAIAPVIAEAGYECVHMGGGGQISSSMYYFRENRFDIVRLLARAMPHTPLAFGTQHKALGQFEVVPESVRELWMKTWAEAGASWTGLNEFLGNYAEMSPIARLSRKLGLKINVPMVYAITPIHTDRWYTRKAAEIAQALKPDIIWIKDSMGLLTPERTRTLVPAILKGIGKIPLGFHSHCNTGLAPLCYLEAVRLGARVVHTCVPPLANGPSLASALNLERNLSLLGYKPMVNRKALEAESAHFAYVAKREGKPIGVPVEYDVSQATRGMAGGVISNLKSFLAQRGMEDRWDEVIDDIQLMGKELGYPPNVTPYSQIMNVQAVLNVSVGERYKVAPDETIRYILGHYGKPPAPVDQNVLDKVSSLPQARRYLNWVQPQPSTEDLRKQVGLPGISGEELLLRILYPKHHVDAMLDAGPIKTAYPRGDRPLMALITELTKKKDTSYVHIQKQGASLALRRYRSCN
ncbi:MAG: biotin carboxyl carrier protein [Chloroflexi bacterium]|nr:biotin carboxyl carrier protein [Chloroflexota bacterium]